jgi:hypothetical protein
VRELDPQAWEPAAGGTISCGLRRDLPKKQRRHDWLDAGPDYRHDFITGGFILLRILICSVCGREDRKAVALHAECKYPCQP